MRRSEKVPSGGSTAGEADSKLGDVKIEGMLAHLEIEPTLRGHWLEEHLREVGVLAARFAQEFGAGELANVAGRWHDIGKYSPDFQYRIRSENGVDAHIENRNKVLRDHATAGATLAFEREDWAEEVRWALALVIAGHHCSKPVHLSKARAGGLPKELEKLSTPAVPQALQTADRLAKEMAVRMLYSALCDADFLDTESFYDQSKSELRRDWPSIESLGETLQRRMAEFESGAVKSRVNDLRSSIRKQCLNRVGDAPGFFSLTVPTGGGKTLAAMSFALEHARLHSLRRVVVAIPFTSIIEQNADVYRRYLGEDAVLEHHSALEPTSDASETARTRIASENWDAPVIVTTTVQLLESLFSNRSSACRKLHRLANSVIILDEAQSLPVCLLGPTLDGLKTLVRDYGATIVFSTATQPAFKQSSKRSWGIAKMRELVDSPASLFQQLERVKIEWPNDVNNKTSWESLADELCHHDNVLVVVHRRNDARVVTELLDERLSDQSTIHLSALMTAAHRSEVLAELKKRKSRGEPSRLVATQLVEAGVDLDFPIVYRALAGLDSIAQAAGRCNREGQLAGLGTVKVFVAPTEPPKGILQVSVKATRELLSQGPLRIDDPRDFETYFSTVYRSVDVDKKGIQALRERFNFPKVAENYRIIENDWSAPLVIATGEAKEAIEHLKMVGATRDTLRKLQRHTVNVPKKLVDVWRAQGHVERVEPVDLLTDPTAYSWRFGLLLNRVGISDAASLIVDE
jgi:CRISPR-associated endonuclease/helicase Cas3